MCGVIHRPVQFEWPLHLTTISIRMWPMCTNPKWITVYRVARWKINCSIDEWEQRELHDKYLKRTPLWLASPGLYLCLAGELLLQGLTILSKIYLRSAKKWASQYYGWINMFYCTALVPRFTVICEFIFCVGLWISA